MRRCLLVMILLLASYLGGSAGTVPTAERAELEQRLLAYLNEQMYNSCKSVVLTRETDDGYEGFVQFVNGQRADVRVSVADEHITYEFLGRASDSATAREAASDSPSAAAQSRPFTYEMYRKIEKGMSFAQVADILGAGGDRLSSSYFDDAVNEVWVWINSDDSHVCAVFRDGAVLMRTQSGLWQPARAGRQERQADSFGNWVLARQIDGRIVPLDLSFGQWLDQVYEVSSKSPDRPRVDIVEEDSRIIVELSYEDAERAGKSTSLYLTHLAPEELDTDTLEISSGESVCVPAGVRVDGKEDNDPGRAWEIMADLGGMHAKRQ